MNFEVSPIEACDKKKFEIATKYASLTIIDLN